jgi:Polysulphide reductase, NrfD
MHTRGIELQLETLREIRAHPRRALDILRGIPAPPSQKRDMTAAVGEEGGPASWRPETAGAPVAFHQADWRDAEWSSIYRLGTEYAATESPDPELIAQANLRGRRGAMPDTIQGPMLHGPVWSLEVPLYFWFGGMAAGSAFVAVACDLTGDARSARIARAVSLAALAPCPPLLIMDLGRPERFHYMLRIFKLRSPMSTGSWCLSAFGGLLAGAIGADLLGWRKTAKAMGAATAVAGTYLGSYTGVLLAATAVPVWGRSRSFLGPIFVSTATLTGASATRLTLSATGLKADHPTRIALARIENAAMASELLLSAINRQRLGDLEAHLDEGGGSAWFRRATWLGRAALATRLVRKPRRLAEHAGSVCFMGAALCYRMAWVMTGKSSAEDAEAVARSARERVHPVS